MLPMPRDFNPHERGTLECQLANLADEIAYNTSDLDDGLRSGILVPRAVAQLAIARKVLTQLDLLRTPTWVRTCSATGLCAVLSAWK